MSSPATNASGCSISDGGTVYVNDTLAELLGYSVAEMMPMNLLDLLDETGKVQGAAFLASQRETGGSRDTSDTMFLRRDGVPVWILINYGPWNSNDGRYLGLVFFVADVTNRRRLHDELQQREDQLARPSAQPAWAAGNGRSRGTRCAGQTSCTGFSGCGPQEFEATFEGYLRHDSS